ncbi:hypothetical protein ABZW30_42785 [Kitasatospora sp. NPDC004669]|uniref:YncE family protein n=1 Tax=Kitasatospora sp. NPDC004669 TaxID=3154555 RepID=UPI0033A54365
MGVIDTATNTLVSGTAAPDQPRPAGTSPGALGALAVSPDGTRVYVTQGGPASANRPAQEGARVLQFSPQQQAFTATVTVPGRSPGSIVARPDSADAYVSTGNGLVHLDTSDETPVVAGTIAVPSGAFLALSPDGTRLYGVGGGKDYIVDLATDTVTATMDIAPGQQLQNPSVSADGTRLYMVQQSWDSGKTSVLSLDTSTNTLVPTEGVTGLDRVTSLVVGPDAHTFYVTVNAGLRIIGF